MGVVRLENDPAAEADLGLAPNPITNLNQIKRGMMSEGKHTQELPPGMIIGPDGKPCRACGTTSA